MALKISDIQEISKVKGNGYEITFTDGRKIIMSKKRTIPALLTLIKHGEGCENDLTKSTTNLADLKAELDGKIPNDLIAESYSDANKPFSELWNEEGFVFIGAEQGGKRNNSQKYILNADDHEKLFDAAKKAKRKPPSKTMQTELLKLTDSKCNICGSIVKEAKAIPTNTFYRDRVRLVWDHRRPVEKNGDSQKSNFQPLCFACNKYKWQVCSICNDDGTNCSKCVLAHPEKNNLIFPTKEDISDRRG